MIRRIRLGAGLVVPAEVIARAGVNLSSGRRDEIEIAAGGRNPWSPCSPALTSCRR